MARPCLSLAASSAVKASAGMPSSAVSTGSKASEPRSSYTRRSSSASVTVCASWNPPTRVRRRAENGVTLDFLAQLCEEGREREALLPVETALDDIPALAVTDEDAFRLKQGRSVVLLPRQVETLRPQFAEGSRTVSAMGSEGIVALCEMRAGRLNPVRVFNLDAGD